jgi:S1-C subfamily serine protease
MEKGLHMHTMAWRAGVMGGVILVLALGLWPLQTQAEFPGFPDLSKANVSLELEGFRFAAGLQPNDKGKPNGNGTELVPASGNASGFVVKSDGTLVTNYHVARRMLKGRAIFQGGATYEVTQLRGYSRNLDLALLKIRATDPLPTVLLGDSNTVQPLDKVLAVGNTLSQGLAVSDGIVNQVIRDRKSEDQIVAFRHSATIAPGNSGGALYRDKEVIGVNFLIRRDYPIYYAIPINAVKSLVQQAGDSIAPLTEAFFPDLPSIVKKAEQIWAKSGQVEAKSGQSPAVWKIKVDLDGLTDFAIFLKGPEDRDLDLVIWNEEGKPIGYGGSNEKGRELVLLSNDHEQTATIDVLNFDDTPAEFGLIVYRIVW